MREIIYALVYLVCAAVVTAFPAFLLFLLFREQPDVSGSERMGTLVSRTVETKPPALAAAPALEDPQPRGEPVWIVPTPQYEYDPPSNAPTGANALEAFATDTDHEDTSREKPVKKISSPKERQVITPQSHSAYGRGSDSSAGEIDRRAVFDTPPLAPD